MLDKICRLDLKNIEHVEHERRGLWPRARKEEEEEKSRQMDRDERRRKARERQQKLMAEFASKQRQFMEKARETASWAACGNFSFHSFFLSLSAYFLLASTV